MGDCSHSHIYHGPTADMAGESPAISGFAVAKRSTFAPVAYVSRYARITDSSCFGRDIITETAKSAQSMEIHFYDSSVGIHSGDTDWVGCYTGTRCPNAIDAG